jgi:DNA-binding GntR family transcriptional regulator
VSRTPLREALRMLERDRLIEESSPHTQVTISRLPIEGLTSLYALRIVGEALAIWLTVPTLDRAACLGLSRELKAIDAGPLEAAQKAHRRFHAGLRTAAGTSMREELSVLFVQAERYQRAYSTKSSKSRAQGEHRAILRACRAGDREAAMAGLVDHIASTAYGLLNSYGGDTEAVRLDAAVRMAKQGLTD